MRQVGFEPHTLWSLATAPSNRRCKRTAGNPNKIKVADFLSQSSLNFHNMLSQMLALQKNGSYIADIASFNETWLVRMQKIRQQTKLYVNTSIPNAYCFMIKHRFFMTVWGHLMSQNTLVYARMYRKSKKTLKATSCFCFVNKLTSVDLYRKFCSMFYFI